MLTNWFWRLLKARGGDWAPLPIRAIVGYGFVEHGYAKLMRGPDAFATILQAIGVPSPHLMAWATELVEVLGGLAILAGALVPIASIPMIAVLLTAIFTVHLPNGFSSIKLQSVTSTGAHFGQPGYETDLLYIAGLLTLVLGGSGKYSIDRVLARKRWGGQAECTVVDASPGNPLKPHRIRSPTSALLAVEERER